MSLRKATYIAAVVCLIAAPAGAQINFPDFTDGSALTLNGAAATGNNGVDPGPVLRLVPVSFNNAGSALNTAAVCLSAFSTQFEFRITGAGPAGSPDGAGQIGADGFALIIAAGPAALGGGGGGLGYSGLTPSVAVEFDTWFNGFDPDSNHVGINVNGNFASVAAAPVPGRFDDGSLWSAWVDYDGTTLEVRVSNTGVRPAAPALSRAIDIPAILGGTAANVGFTAGTGAAYGNHDVVSWSFDEQCGNIVLDGCGTGVADHRVADGSLFSESVQACAVDSTEHGGFVSCVAALGTQSMRAGSITGRQRGAIQSCAARSSFHKGAVQTAEFIENGNFETGNANGWTLLPGSGRLTVDNGTLEPFGPPTPQPPIAGAFNLVADTNFQNTSRAMQAIDVPLEVHGATLEWLDRLQSAGPFSDPFQEYRVVIRRADLSLVAELFSTNAGDPPVQLGPNTRSADLTAALQPVRGQKVYISFEQRVTCCFFAIAIDEVSLTLTYR